MRFVTSQLLSSQGGFGITMPRRIKMQNKSKRRLSKSKFIIGALALMLCAPSLSLGWRAGGHMMVAYIAYQRLNPSAKAHVNKLLAIPINPAEISANSKDFVNAAHWADDLRPFAEFDSFKELHFIDTPFSIDGTRLPKVPKPNIVTALEDNVKILRTSTDPKAQAQALRFIIHFVGDIHQPLHCATRVRQENPEGDRGGNLVSISIPGAGRKAAVKKSNLHSYWDGGIDSFPKTGPNFSPPPLSEIPAAAALAMKGNSPSSPDLRLNDPFNFQSWADESFALAQDVAYKEMKNGAEPSVAYKARALKVARQRVAWGGYRLAALLNAIWP